MHRSGRLVARWSTDLPSLSRQAEGGIRTSWFPYRDFRFWNVMAMRRGKRRSWCLSRSPVYSPASLHEEKRKPDNNRNSYRSSPLPRSHQWWRPGSAKGRARVIVSESVQLTGVTSAPARENALVWRLRRRSSKYIPIRGASA